MPVKIGELLLKQNMVTPQQVQEALTHQKMNGGKLSKAFVTLGYARDDEITSLLSRLYGVPSIDLGQFEVDPAIVKMIPAETVRKYQVLPLSRSGATLSLAMADPTNVFAMDDIKYLTGYNIEPVVASETSVEEAIERSYGSTRSLGPQHQGAGEGAVKTEPDGPGLTLDDLASVGLSEVDLDAFSDAEADAKAAEEAKDEIDLGTLSRSADAPPVVKLTNVLLVDSLKRGASDIHIEPYRREFRVRFRIDGILYNVMALPMKLRDPLTSRIKLMARLDVSEKRLPQEGRIRIRMSVEDRSRELDFRVSCLPTLWGEKIVLRLLDKSKLMLDMTRLGFEPHALGCFKKAIARPHGLVLFTGPLGSGKTNTLYSALAALNKPDINITTIEAPVTFSLPGINQIAIRFDLCDFPAALRSCLSQDTNVLAVDRIGDDETAKEVVRQGARTGRLVLATLLGLDATSAVVSLAARSGHPSDLARALHLVVAQRLIRRICTGCKVEVTDACTKTLIEIGVAPEQVGGFKLYKGEGCRACSGTGYKGRVGLYEVMEVSDTIHRYITVGAVAWEIKRKALEEGMLTLRMSGIEKIKAGITTIEEVLRETSL